jgi:hypothetical protein
MRELLACVHLNFLWYRQGTVNLQPGDAADQPMGCLPSCLRAVAG